MQNRLINNDSFFDKTYSNLYKYEDVLKPMFIAIDKKVEEIVLKSINYNSYQMNPVTGHIDKNDNDFMVVVRDYWKLFSFFQEITPYKTWLIAQELMPKIEIMRLDEINLFFKMMKSVIDEPFDQDNFLVYKEDLFKI